jgi:hypothetical protein
MFEHLLLSTYSSNKQAYPLRINVAIVDFNVIITIWTLVLVIEAYPENTFDIFPWCKWIDWLDEDTYRVHVTVHAE